MILTYENDTVVLDFEGKDMTDGMEDLRVLLQAAYDSGRWGHPGNYNVFYDQYFRQQELDKASKKAELELKIMYIDEVTTLQAELQATKEKYIGLLEAMTRIKK